MKQLHDNPSERSVLLGWKLMLRLCQQARCRSQLCSTRDFLVPARCFGLKGRRTNMIDVYRFNLTSKNSIFEHAFLLSLFPVAGEAKCKVGGVCEVEVGNSNPHPQTHLWLQRERFLAYMCVYIYIYLLVKSRENHGLCKVA